MMESRPITNLFKVINIGQDVVSIRRMMLHSLKFFICQFSRLFQNFISNGYFSNIMQCPCKIHFLHSFLIKSHMA